MQKLLKLLLLSSLVASVAYAQEEGLDSQALLALFHSDDAFQFQVTVKTDIRTREIIQEAELCITNKCDMFELRGEHEDVKTLLDFVFIYTVYASGYGDLRSVRNGQVPPLKFIVQNYKRGPALLDKYGSNCPRGVELERAKCVIEKMYAELHIDFYSVSYDGMRFVYPRPDLFLPTVTVKRMQAQRERIEKSVH